MPPAKSISAASLAKLTQSAVKTATAGTAGRFIGKGGTIGYILRQELSHAAQIELATKIVTEVSANAKAAGISGLRAKPVVVARPGKIIAGFLAHELNIAVRG